MSPILNAMRTYLTPALFNSKVNELKRHVPKMQTSNQFFLFQQMFYCWFISRLLVMAYKK